MLVKYGGVAIDVAFNLDEVWADALGIAFGEFEGGHWNWNTLSWDNP